MVSLRCSASPFQSTLGFHHPSCRADFPAITVLKLGFTIPPTPTALNFRVKNDIKLQLKRRLLRPSASNTNPSDGDSLKEEPDGGRKTGDATQGPPFLTILAGLLVFFVISWVIGSIVMWLIGLIVHLPPK
ncbi:uncharacterized protein LOC132299278 [Cornus florida]|uniref:uncharacterized protein LOC132299278 n=1 Tax=Cornus florida TaxID=4283 RepID=UPI00289FE361|nr:uncharacterized protein LOC132299278 [Cornus florida]